MAETKKRRELDGLCKDCGKSKQRSSLKLCDACIKGGTERKRKSRQRKRLAKEKSPV